MATKKPMYEMKKLEMLEKLEKLENLGNFSAMVAWRVGLRGNEQGLRVFSIHGIQPIGGKSAWLITARIHAKNTNFPRIVKKTTAGHEKKNRKNDHWKL